MAARKTGAFTKFRLLMWKNFLQQWRHRLRTLVETLLPVVTMMMVLLLRWQVEPLTLSMRTYPALSASSLSSSLSILRWMDFTNLSIAYSPESPILQNVLRQATTKLFGQNMRHLIPMMSNEYPELGIPPDLQNVSEINRTLFNDIFETIISINPYENSESLRTVYSSEEVTRRVIAAVEFEDNLYGATQLTGNMQYSLRFPETPRQYAFNFQGSQSWHTDLTFPAFQLPGPRNAYNPDGGNSPGYISEMFIALQHSISMEIIAEVTEQDLDNFDVFVQRFPHPQYLSDLAVELMEYLLPIFIVTSFSYTAVNLVKAVVIEKELQLKETMKIMGLPTWLHWTAWFCKQFVFLLVVAILIVIILKVRWFTSTDGLRSYGVMTNTPWSVLLLLLLLYLACMIFFCFMVSGIFSKSSTAATFAGILWFLTYAPSVVLMLQIQISPLVQGFMCLSINTAMAFGFQLILNEENVGGMQWGQFWQTIDLGSSRFTFGTVLVMLLVDCVLYMLIALYLEQVFPGPYGAPKPWYFMFQKSFWFPKESVNPDNVILDPDDLLNIVTEQISDNHTFGVKMMNLTKAYGANIAVNNLCLDICDGHITVLLGHNGAGKSTTISMLTGNIEITSGSVWVAGYDVATQTAAARQSLGFCPQHNVLFNDMTVREHLEFFARLKGFTGQELQENIDTLITKLELNEKCESLAAGLSGGLKRRLSVGIALCGAPRVILLDEPTSGMDVASRRALWDLLQKEKQGRSIILTTHFMDEADILGDRVAIMSNGRLQCVGSPYFLKSHYGVGYTLVVVKDEDFHLESCTDVIRRHIADVSVKEDRGTEVTYALSNDNLHLFGAMLRDLEKNSGKIKFKNYGLATTTLEDVFMTVGSDMAPFRVPDDGSTSSSRDETNTWDIISSIEECCDWAEYLNMSINLAIFITLDLGMSLKYDKNRWLIGQHQQHLSIMVPLTAIANPYAMRGYNVDKGHDVLSGMRLWMQHVLAVWLKLWLVGSRSWRILLLQVLMPIMLLSLNLGILQGTMSIPNTSLEPRALTLEQGYRETETVLSYNGVSSNSLGALSKAAYEYMFRSSNTENMRLTLVENQNLDDYYLLRTNEPSEMAYLRNRMLTGATFGDSSATAWFSNFGYHDVATSLSAVHEALLKTWNQNATLRVTNHPLEVNYMDQEPFQDNIDTDVLLISTQVSAGIANCIGIASAVFVMFYIKERVIRAKLLQKASGIKPVIMWGAAAVFDWLWFLVICLTIVFTCLAFQVHGLLNTAAELGRMYLVLMVYGAAMPPLVYLISLIFKKPATGFAIFYFINIIAGQMVPPVIDILLMPLVDAEEVARILDYILQFYPIYSLIRAVTRMNNVALTEWSCMQTCNLMTAWLPIEECSMQVMCDNGFTNCCVRDNPFFDWEEPGVLRYIIAMLASCVVLWSLLMMIEYNVFIKILSWTKTPPARDEQLLDDDVVAEIRHAEQIANTNLAQHSLVVKSLSKYYKSHLAVNQVSFTVADTEVFGLLGMNGAGKTTTFKMLMGDETVSSGDAFISGHSVKTDITSVHKNIGYCPQFDAVFGELTGRETLRLFSMLRGLPSQQAARRADLLADSLGFREHLDKRVDQFSGGNKRKLSTAVSLLGFTRLVFVDEPTTGVDPAAKRQVWRAIRNVSQAGRGVVMTSHSMEECDALCSRLTIMALGNFKCLGTPQHLKNKFSHGFTLKIKMKMTVDRTDLVSDERGIEAVKRYVQSHFDTAKLIEEFQGLITYYLPDQSVAWSKMFATMERCRKDHDVDDYTISQTTLEQVFLRFAKNQGNNVVVLQA